MNALTAFFYRLSVVLEQLSLNIAEFMSEECSEFVYKKMKAINNSWVHKLNLTHFSHYLFYPALTGSKTPPQDSEKIEALPVKARLVQLTPTEGSFTLSLPVILYLKMTVDGISS
ncbi:hypothetical protein [Bacillus rhizoplanae]|uniref:hypothetical protein n=1 Tax=Bacillus rhizoplanae TaxID=2880966 RepID=UPI003D26001D